MYSLMPPLCLWLESVSMGTRAEVPSSDISTSLETLESSSPIAGSEWAKKMNGIYSGMYGNYSLLPISFSGELLPESDTDCSPSTLTLREKTTQTETE